MRLAALLIILTLSLIPLSANPFGTDFNWALHGSLFLFAADNGVDSDPAPILPSLGFSASWNAWGNFRLELSGDIYTKNYEYNSKLGYAMGSNPENRSAFVLGLITGVQLSTAFPLGENGKRVRVFGGPAADFRLVTLAFGLNHPSDFTGDIETDARLQTDAIRKYFWSEGRWLFPVVGSGIDFPINEKFMLGFDVRTWFPVYRLWTDKDLPAIDGWRFGVGFRLTPRRDDRPVRTPRSREAAPEQTETEEDTAS